MAENLRPVKIMVACGSGIATSMSVAMALKEKLAERKLNVEISSCGVNELLYRTEGSDLIVCTAQVPFETKQPVVNAVPFLTGIGEQETVEKIVELIREINASR
jgi:PTS system galactitol-specific IIB component